jgi:hypothetical protein
MADLDLGSFDITYGSSMEDFLEMFPDAQDQIDEILKEERDRLVLLLLQAFKAYVPVDTRELRNIDIKKSVSNSTGRVFVADLRHINTKFKRKKPQAPDLALILDEGEENGIKLHRRANAQPAGPFSGPGRGASTANWIDRAWRDWYESI